MVPRSFPGHRDAALQKCSLLVVGGGPTLDYPDATASSPGSNAWSKNCASGGCSDRRCALWTLGTRDSLIFIAVVAAALVVLA